MKEPKFFTMSLKEAWKYSWFNMIWEEQGYSTLGFIFFGIPITIILYLLMAIFLPAILIALILVVPPVGPWADKAWDNVVRFWMFMMTPFYKKKEPVVDKFDNLGCSPRADMWFEHMDDPSGKSHDGETSSGCVEYNIGETKKKLEDLNSFIKELVFTYNAGERKILDSLGRNWVTKFTIFGIYHVEYCYQTRGTLVKITDNNGDLVTSYVCQSKQYSGILGINDPVFDMSKLISLVLLTKIDGKLTEESCKKVLSRT